MPRPLEPKAKIAAGVVQQNAGANSLYMDFTSAADLEVSTDGGTTYNIWDLSSVGTYPHVIVTLPTCLWKVSVDTFVEGSAVVVK